MLDRRIRKIFTYSIAAVWIVNGLFCKVLNLVPRHQQIVASILGERYATPLTMAIGMAEIGMAVWILSGKKSRMNAVMQIGAVATMNVMEYILVPDLLLWGRSNSIFASLFILVVYYNEFVLKKLIAQPV